MTLVSEEAAVHRSFFGVSRRAELGVVANTYNPRTSAIETGNTSDQGQPLVVESSTSSLNYVGRGQGMGTGKDGGIAQVVEDLWSKH